LASLYGFIGVWFPFMEWRIERSRPVWQICVHVNKFVHLKNKSHKSSLAWGHWIGFASKILGLACPIHVSLLPWHTYEEQALLFYRMEQHRFQTCLLLCTFAGLVGMLVFECGKLDNYILNATKVAIQGLIEQISAQGKHFPDEDVDVKEEHGTGLQVGKTSSREVSREDDVVCKNTSNSTFGPSISARVSLLPPEMIEPDFEQADFERASLDSSHHEQEQQWIELSRHHWYLQKALIELWDLDCIGLLWSTRIALLAAASLGLEAYGIGKSDPVLRYTIQGVGFCLAALSSLIMLRLAEVTKLCMGHKLGAQTLLAVTLKQQVDLSRVTQQNNFEIFCNRVSHQKMGVEIGGMLVDHKLVLGMIARVLVYVPVTLGVLGAYLHPGARVISDSRYALRGVHET